MIRRYNVENENYTIKLREDLEKVISGEVSFLLVELRKTKKLGTAIIGMKILHSYHDIIYIHNLLKKSLSQGKDVKKISLRVEFGNDRILFLRQ